MFSNFNESLLFMYNILLTEIGRCFSLFNINCKSQSVEEKHGILKFTLGISLHT